MTPYEHTLAIVRELAFEHNLREKRDRTPRKKRRPLTPAERLGWKSNRDVLDTLKRAPIKIKGITIE